MDPNTEISTSNHYEVFLLFCLHSLRNLGTKNSPGLTPPAYDWLVTVPELILSLTSTAAERTWIYNKHISRDRYPASLLAGRTDLQKTRHVVYMHCCATSPRTWKTQLPLLLRVGPCLQSCCLTTRWSNPLHYQCIIYRESREEWSVFWEVTVSVILSKKVYVHVSYSKRFPR
jgi:hypothetical protein